MKCALRNCLIFAQLTYTSLYGQFYFSSGNKTEPELLWEAGISAGGMNCLTDIGGNTGAGKKFIKDINWDQTQPGGGLFVNATWHYGIGIHLAAGTGRVAGTDAVLKNKTGTAHNRYLRNLQFRTNISELVLEAELYPLMLLQQAAPLFSPYLVAGIGTFVYNPQAWINNTWVDLRPLHTEGEGFKEYPERRAYGSFSWCAPVGAGVKYDAAGLINLRLEILYRFTGTDYLDDVSTAYINPSLFSKYLSPLQTSQAVQLADRSAALGAGIANHPNDIRGNAANKDAWFSVMLKASIVLGRLQHKQ